MCFLATLRVPISDAYFQFSRSSPEGGFKPALLLLTLGRSNRRYGTMVPATRYAGVRTGLDRMEGHCLLHQGFGTLAAGVAYMGEVGKMNAIEHNALVVECLPRY